MRELWLQEPRRQGHEGRKGYVKPYLINSSNVLRILVGVCICRHILYATWMRLRLRLMIHILSVGLGQEEVTLINSNTKAIYERNETEYLYNFKSLI